MYQTGCNAYKKSAGNSVEDNRVVLIKLFDGVLKFIANARRGILAGSPKIRGENISKAMAIIEELNCALDMEKGGQMAAQLDSLYGFAMDRLTSTSMNNDLQALDDAEHVLAMLKEGFENAVMQLKSQTVDPPAMKVSNSLPEGVRFAV